MVDFFLSFIQIVSKSILTGWFRKNVTMCVLYYLIFSKTIISPTLKYTKKYRVLLLYKYNPNVFKKKT